MAQRTGHGGRRKGAGRPPKPDGLTERRTLFLSASDADWVAETAESNDTSEGDVLRGLIARARASL